MSNASTTVWQPTGVWAGTALATPRRAAGNDTPVLLTPYGHVDMAALIVAEGRSEVFAARVRDMWEMDVPATGRASLGQRDALLYVAPDQYLLYAPEGLGDDELARAFEGTAAVSLQGDGRAVVGLSGAASRKVLSKGISINLHPDVFHAGCCAGTALAHGAVQLVRTSDAPDYLLIVPRTVAASIADWLIDSAAEYGFEIRAEHLNDFGARAA